MGVIGDQVDHLVYGYIEKGRASLGTLPRVALNALPAALLLIFWKRYAAFMHASRRHPSEARVWLSLAAAGVLLTVAFFVSPSSTAVDRIGLYLIPLQMYVYSIVWYLFHLTRETESLGKATVFAMYFVSMVAWFEFGSHSYLWIPYKTLIL